MLNLSEQWKQAYAEYLEEQDSRMLDDIDIICKELNEAQAEVSRGYKLLEDYCTVILEAKNEEGGDPSPKEGGSGNVNVNITKNGENDKINGLIKQLIQLGSTEVPTAKDKEYYTPTATYTTQKISDMSFPENIMFFLAQLIKWIRNVVVYFIEKFKNLLKRLVGMETTELDPSKLTLDLKRSKKIEQISQTLDLGRKNDQVVRAWTINPSDISLLEGESFAQMLGIVKDKPEVVKKDRVIVTVDLSRDIFALKELMSHFYDLFDGAYGSNNEKLFATDDLEVILDIFKDTIKKVKTGDLNTYSIGGSAIEVSGISKDRVRENLILTNTNINKLKEAYMTTSAKIQDITKIINSKEMMMLNDMGVDFRLLTSSTYEQLKKILDTMPARFREAKKLERDLTKVQSKYEKLTQELASMQRNVATVSNVTYDTVASKRLIDLLSAANWMSQTITLRIAGLGLYIRELKDVRDAIVMLSKVNLSKGDEKKLYKF